ncbi:glutamine ABC transporter membrane-spanning permease [Streptococcus pneumoniae]|nr:glutamine ABC transporter membrane-spanning permease [Streptococcus pneumoniae]
MQDSGIQVLFQGNNLLRILQGLGVTIGISILSVLLSMMFGTVMGIIMTSHSRIIRFLTPNHSYLSQLDVTYQTPDLMSHFLPPHEVSFTFCCSSIVFPR